MSQRILIEIPEHLHKKVKSLSGKVGLPTSAMISMMVVDTLMNPNLEVTEVKREKGEKKFTRILISLDSEYYTKVVYEFVNRNKGYSVKNFILDCIEYQLENFEAMCTTKTPEHTKRKRIYSTKKDIYNEETIENNQRIVPMEDYISIKSAVWGISAGTIKKYFLSKQINEIIGKYEKERELYGVPEEDGYDYN